MPDGGDQRAERLGSSGEAAPCDRRPLSPHLRRPRKPLESLVPGRGHEGRVHGLQHGRADGEGQLPRAPSYKAEWTKDDAEKALAAALLDVHPAASKAGGTTVAQAVERYLAITARKRTIEEDRRQPDLRKAEFGAETPLADVTASRISEYKAKRLSAVRTIGQGERAVERRLTAAAVNRPLALFRHLLRLAHEDWEVIDTVPRIRLEKEPQGRLRWLTQEEITRLLNETVGASQK